MSLKVVFIVGGPGAGKSTHCTRLVEKDPGKYVHVSVGDILRAEVKEEGSKWATVIKENMQKGIVGDKEMTVGLLQDYISNFLKEDQTRILLLDGFPRSLDRALLFEERVAEPKCVVRLLRSWATAKESLLERGRKDNAREDDLREDMIRQRLNACNEGLEAVEKHYIMKGLSEKGDPHAYNVVIYASRSVKEVMAEVEAAIAERVT